MTKLLPFYAVALQDDDPFVHDTIEALIADHAKDGLWQVGDCVTYWDGKFYSLTASDLLSADIDGIGDCDLDFVKSMLGRMGQFVETYYPDAPEPFPTLEKCKVGGAVIELRAMINKAVDQWAEQNGLQPKLNHMAESNRRAVRIESLDPVKVSSVHIADIDDSQNDDGGWNLDGSGLPSSEIVYRALVTWLTGQCVKGRYPKGSSDIRSAAIALGATDDVIKRVARIYDGISVVGEGDEQFIVIEGDADLIRSNLSDHYWYSAVQCVSIAISDDDARVSDVAAALCTTAAHVRSICCGPFMNVGDDDCIEHDGE
ncbi:hypothetical protein TH9_12285 [Thalassospira xiamenensis]|uniref:hypothetical protein n=1 Tax=Thalassospira xiamenensis TaxID=220697 RepID=UPI000DED9AD6|nr:hypothetical protein [Thalassospira xiamenensis]RCK32502.1 hypothetical protein TH9_12285 [Thalassospira xiamenensis]